MKRAFRSCWLVVAFTLCGSPSFCQDLRVYTTIRDLSRIRDLSSSVESAKPDQAPVVVRSLMLFHAGKVYDYIEPAREVTIFEPAHRRFTVMNSRRQLSSELTQDEIRQFLGLAEDEAQKRLLILSEESSLAAKKALEILRFQFRPDFAARFDAEKWQLSMEGDHCRYLVDGVQPPSAEVLEQYLHMADWMAQLNSVLHPQSLFPAPRLKLNQELRSRGMLPLTVVLKTDTDPSLHLQAQHKWGWSFESKDRQMIDEWEKQSRDPNLKKLPFRQFQQEMLKTEITRKR